MVVTELIFKKLIFAQQLFAKDSYPKCDKNPSDSLVTDTRSWKDSLHLSVYLTFITKTVGTACSRTSYKIVPLNNLNKYFHSDTSETGVIINTRK